MAWTLAQYEEAHRKIIEKSGLPLGIQMLMLRGPRYIRLGYTYKEIMDNNYKLCLDDQLWEKAKTMPIDPNNWLDRANQKVDEIVKLGSETAQGKKIMKELKEELRKNLIESTSYKI